MVWVRAAVTSAALLSGCAGLMENEVRTVWITHECNGARHEVRLELDVGSEAIEMTAFPAKP